MKRAVFLIVILLALAMLAVFSRSSSPGNQGAGDPAPQVSWSSLTLFPSDTPAQGTTLMVKITGASTTTLSATFNGNEYAFFPYADSLIALVPVPLDESLGEKTLDVGGRAILFSVDTGNYEIETVPPPQATPVPAEENALRERERAAIENAYQNPEPRILFAAPFTPPLEAMTVTSPFGSGRTIEGSGVVTARHQGVDLRASVGAPVYAVNDGVVKLAANYSLEGNFAVVDHGFGIDSLYLHLSKLTVATGDYVVKGQVIGLSGATGQILGPHLHFGIKINGIAVDPLEFLKLW